MNIVIPMAGLGSRFPTHLYPMPKPLITINGESMISLAVKSLNLSGKYHFIIAQNEYTEKIKSEIKMIGIDSNFLEINYLTEGPAASALLAEKFINNDSELVIANCDQIMRWNSDHFIHSIRLFDAGVVTYHADTDKNSYAKLNQNGMVVEIREKEVISNVSLNGIHYWKMGSLFVKSAKQMEVAQDRAPNGELYVGPTYNYLIKDGYRVGIYHIPNEQHCPVGVPSDLQHYLEMTKNENI